MASWAAEPKEHTDYGCLIEFVRSTDSSSNRLKQSGDSAGAKLSSVSGAEAKSFYEELCANDVSKCNEKIVIERKKGKCVSDLKKKERKTANISHCEQSSVDKNDKSTVVNDFSLGCQSESKCGGHFDRKFVETGTISNDCVSGSVVQTSTSGTGRGKCWSSGRQPRYSQRIKDYRHSELLKLAQNGNNEGVKILIQQGADINHVDHFGWTAAMSAAFEGHTDVVQTLVQAGADLTIKNSQGETALSLAEKKGCADVVTFIDTFYKIGLHAFTSEEKKEHFVSFYCNVCKSDFTESDQLTHERSTVHIFNSGRKPKDDTFLIPPSNIGFQLMMKTGWDGNKGLGPSGQGQRFPVKTCLKRDREGLGNTVTHKAKVTHFKANDRSAVVRAHYEGKKRIANVRTLSRRAQRAKEKKERQWEMDMRQHLS